MIGYIKGKVLDVSDGVALIENNGIGYEVICSSECLELLKNGDGGIYVYTAVREDGIFLYGFNSLEEKNMFKKLISVSGVGPKMGIAVLSGMKLKDLALKIAQSDVKGLSSIKGLGKKTAERIILELREKVVGEDTEGEKQPEKAIEPDGKEMDSVIALMSLGLKKAEAINLVKEAKNGGAVSVEETVTYALKHLR